MPFLPRSTQERRALFSVLDGVCIPLKRGSRRGHVHPETGSSITFRRSNQRAVNQQTMAHTAPAAHPATTSVGQCTSM